MSCQNCVMESWAKGLCKKCYSREYNKEYRRRNKATLNAKSRKYYAANQTRLRKYNKAYVEAHKTQIKRQQMAYHRTDNGRFKQAKSNARRRGIEWKLTLSEFIDARKSGACHYCASALPDSSCGLDRKDNTVGYMTTNVVPCCARCNDMKGPHISYDEMCLLWQRRKAMQC